jgi:Na+/proline symporter
MTPCESSEWETRRFSWPDYAVFAATLSVSLAIGIFHGFCAGGKQRTTAEFLMGNRKMNFFTLGASLTVG